MRGRGFCRRVTSENLERFRALLRTSAGATPDQGASPTPEPVAPEDPARTTAEQLFAGKPIEARPPFRPPSVRGAVRRTAHAREGDPTRQAGDMGSVAVLRAGRPVLWKKALKASDVQRQLGHPTGGIRLTQAGFRDPGDPTGGLIDHTTYFRRLFSGFDWRVTKTDPLVEEAHVPFDVVVQRRRLGRHVLAVSHKPSGEAGQRNYTSILKWGELGATVRSMSLAGKTLTLYGSRQNQDEPYLILIS